MGLIYSFSSFLGKYKGERVSLIKIGGGRRVVDFRVSRGLDVETFLVVVGEIKYLEDREKDVFREGRR